MSAKLNYRPDVDGLRAFAVIGVVLYHFNFPFIPGGFVGVDVFFVISGYLITSLMWREMRHDEFSLMQFYARRLRRLLPALALVILFTLVSGWFLLAPGEYSQLASSATFGILGLGNLFFYWNTGYFQQSAQLAPLLHTWSLGVEEQFYLVWPLFLLVAVKVWRIRIVALIFILLIVLAGFAISVLELPRNPKAAFYILHARGWELALGALISFAPPIRSRRFAALLSAVGVVIIFAAFGLVPLHGFPGAWALLPCLGASLVLWPKVDNIIARWLAHIRSVGLVSYSLYLWHWPILVFATIYLSKSPSFIESVFLLLLISTLSYLSWRFVEQPFRRDYGLKRTFGVGILACLSVATLATSITATDGAISRMPKALTAVADPAEMWEWDCPKTVSANGIQYCGFGADWTSLSKKAVLWGDSHAQHLAPLFDAAVTDVAFILAGPCVPFSGDAIWVDIGESGYLATCREAQRNTLAVIASEDVDYVILSAAWHGRVGQLRTATNHEQPLEKVELGLGNLLSREELAGATVFMILDTPHVGEGLTCQTSSKYLLRGECPSTEMMQSTFVSLVGSTSTVLSKVAAEHGARVIDPSTKLCSTGLCQTHFGDLPFYRDGDHFRRNMTVPERLALWELLSLNTLGF